MRGMRGNLVTAGAGLVVAVLIAELLLRLLGVSYLIAFRGSWDTGLQHIAGAEGWYRDEGEAFIRINSGGFRDVERSVAKPPGTIRVAVLGDSYVEGFQVAQEQTMTAVAERLLGSCAAAGGRRVEVLNFGVSTSGQAQELLVMRSQAMRYQPDVVVDAFLTENDLIDNSFALSQVRERAYLVPQGGQLVLDDTFRRFTGNQQSLPLDAYFWLLPRSRVLQVLHNARTRLTETGVRAENLARFQNVPGGMLPDYPAPRELYREPTDGRWIEAWDVTGQILSQMAREVAAAGARFLVVTLSNDVQVHPDVAERARAARELGVPDLSYPDNRVRSMGARYGFDVLTLAPELADYAQRTGEYLHGFPGRLGHGHWNATGQRLAGERLAADLCARVLPSLVSR